MVGFGEAKYEYREGIGIVYLWAGSWGSNLVTRDLPTEGYFSAILWEVVNLRGFTVMS